MLARNQLLSVGVAVLLAGAAALLLANPASAAEWHAYNGDVFPGHAYGLMVPTKAESFEIVWTGPAGASASLAVYDPAGARVGHYALSEALTAASVAAPAEGSYVLYVYELTGGALNVRVSAPSAPVVLDLQKMPLVREDVAISASDAPARLDKAITANLKAPAVFLTLLYEGSAEELDATVASAKGPAMTITGETGTAFAPGVYSSITGARNLDAANLEGTAYTVEVHAKSFEGTLFLTTLAVDFKTPAPVAPATPGTPSTPNAPATPAPWNATTGATFVFGAGKAYAFQAKAGELLLADPMVNEKDDKSRATYDVHDVIALYAPNDTLLAYVVLDHEDMSATVELPVDGEYVAYVHHARDEVILAKLSGATLAPSLRELPLAEETFAFPAGGLLGGGASEFTLARAPVSLSLEASEGLDALSYASVENEQGTVAYYSALLATPGFEGFEWSEQDPSRFAAGEHVFHAGGLLGQEMTLTALSYLRDGEAPVPVEKVEARTEPAPPAEPPLPTEALTGLVLGNGPLGLFG